MRLAIITCLIFIVSHSGVSQNKPSSWTLLQQEDEIMIYYKYAQCQPRMGYDQELVLLKFVNSSSVMTKEIEWDLEAYWDGNCITCKNLNEYHMKITLIPLQKLEGNCTVECDYKLKIFSKFTEKGISDADQKLLTKFELANLTVKKIN